MIQLYARKIKGNHRHCQDACLIRQLPESTVLAVADGHGGSAYVRSGLGARFACAAAAKLLAAGISTEEFPAAMKDTFDRMTQKHLLHRPLEDWESERLRGLPPLQSYGTTLLAAHLTPEGTRVFQLGDGGIHALDSHGRFLPELPPDPDCLGSITTSLVQPGEQVHSHFRSAFYKDCAVITLFTDGYCCSGRPIGLLEALGDPEATEAALKKGWRGDDQTLLLAVLSDAAASEAFSVGFEKEARLVREEEAARKVTVKAALEYRELYCYLQLAAKTRERMTAGQDPRLEEFNARLQKKLARFNALSDAFIVNWGFGSRKI